MYVDFSAGGKEYKLRLNTRNIVSLEKALGMNPLAIFGNRRNHANYYNSGNYPSRFFAIVSAQHYS